MTLIVFCFLLVLIFAGYGQGERDLYFVDEARYGLFRMPASGGLHTLLGEFNDEFLYQAAYDPVRDCIYWVNQKTSSRPSNIHRYTISSGKTDIIEVPSDSNLYDIAVDYITNLLYVTDFIGDAGGQILIIDFDTEQMKSIYVGGKPTGIALDVKNGWMFWGDQTITGTIKKATMDGSNQQILKNTEVYWPSGMQFDRISERLYIIDGTYGNIYSMDVDGKNEIMHYDSSDHFRCVALDEFYIYVGKRYDGAVYRLLKDSVAPSTLERLGENPSTGSIMGMVATGTLVTLPGGNACSLNNGGCLYMCLPTPEGRTCACPDGISCDEVPTCPEPGHPANGGVIPSGDGMQVGAVVFYYCHPGYNLDGPEFLTCLASGRWSESAPACHVIED